MYETGEGESGNCSYRYWKYNNGDLTIEVTYNFTSALSAGTGPHANVYYARRTVDFTFPIEFTELPACLENLIRVDANLPFITTHCETISKTGFHSVIAYSDAATTIAAGSKHVGYFIGRWK